MFEDDGEFAGRPTDALRQLATDAQASVVLRGRAVLEIGRRAVADPALAGDLLAWAADPTFQRTRWVGRHTRASREPWFRDMDDLSRPR